MKFLYTGASSYNAEQKIAYLSIGGYVSSTEAPNDFINNVFSDLSEYSKQNLTRETILLAIKNEDDDLAYNIKVKINIADFSTVKCAFKIAFQNPTIDNCGNVSFEKINDPAALPYLTFTDVTELENEFLIGNLQPGKIIGMWLSRTPIKDRVASKNCEELNSDFENEVEEEIEETFSIDLEWNDDESNSNSSS